MAKKGEKGELGPQTLKIYKEQLNYTITNDCDVT